MSKNDFDVRYITRKVERFCYIIDILLIAVGLQLSLPLFIYSNSVSDGVLILNLIFCMIGSAFCASGSISLVNYIIKKRFGFIRYND